MDEIASEIFKSNPNAMAILSLAGKFVEINEAFQNLLKVKRESVIGHSIYKVHPQYNDYYDRIEDELKKELKVSNTEIGYVDPDGRHYTLLVSLKLFYHRNQTLILEVITDISDKALLEQDLKETRIRLQTLVDNSMFGLALAKDGKVEYVNIGMAQLLELPYEDVQRMSLEEHFKYIHPDDVNIFQELGEGPEKIRKIFFRIKSAKGNIKHVKANVTRMDYHHELYTQITFFDMTDQVLLEEEQLRLQKMDSIGNIAKVITHDFGNVLTGIVGNIDLLQMESHTPDQAHLIESLKKSAFQARDIIQQVVSFSAGNRVTKRPRDLVELLKHSCKITLKGTGVQCSIEPHEPIPQICLDQNLMIQVFNNIFINARESMPGGGEVKVGIEPEFITPRSSSVLKLGQYLRIDISDQGLGIPGKIQPKIFTPYFSTKPDGLGLGLATSYAIVREHEGLITFSSSEGKGTTFHIYLPQNADCSVAGSLVQLSHQPKPKPSTGKILLMDDRSEIHLIVERMVNKMNISVDHSYNGEDCIEKYKVAEQSGDHYDCVIIDLYIPSGLNGKETIKELLKVDPNIKAIAVSGYAHDPAMVHFEDYGFKAMLKKPFLYAELQMLLMSLIG